MVLVKKRPLGIIIKNVKHIKNREIMKEKTLLLVPTAWKEYLAILSLLKKLLLFVKQEKGKGIRGLILGAHVRGKNDYFIPYDPLYLFHPHIEHFIAQLHKKYSLVFDRNGTEQSILDYLVIKQNKDKLIFALCFEEYYITLNYAFVSSLPKQDALSDTLLHPFTLQNLTA